MADRFDKFTERARRALTLAQEEAKRFFHEYVGTEHLLLGLAAIGKEDPNSSAVRILDRLGIEFVKVRGDVEFKIGRGERRNTEEAGLTLRAKKAIELAVDEAKQFGDDYIGTEHLLTGLVREVEGIAAQVLDERGVNLEKVRNTLKAIREEGSAEQERLQQRAQEALWRRLEEALEEVRSPNGLIAQAVVESQRWLEKNVPLTNVAHFRADRIYEIWVGLLGQLALYPVIPKDLGGGEEHSARLIIEAWRRCYHELGTSPRKEGLRVENQWLSHVTSLFGPLALRLAGVDLPTFKRVQHEQLLTFEF